jgi:hypothetical protein
MKNLILIASILIFTSPLLADNRVAELTQQMPGAKPYEILKQVFEESKDIINWSDFETKTLKCAAAYVDDTHPRGFVRLAHLKSNKVVKPGEDATPARGPLFPPTPAIPPQIETKDFISSQNPDNSQQSYDRIFDEINTVMTLRQITTRIVVERGDKSERTNVITVRKNGELLSFIFVPYYSDEKIYGYCWNE